MKLSSITIEDIIKIVQLKDNGFIIKLNPFQFLTWQKNNVYSHFKPKVLFYKQALLFVCLKLKFRFPCVLTCIYRNYDSDLTRIYDF